MDTMQVDDQIRERPFNGLRRSRSRVIGGVARGLADYWLVDPTLLRVLLVSPVVAAVLALLTLPWSEAILGSVTVLITQVLWVAAAGVVLGYLVAWLLIPPVGADSPMRRFLDLGGAFGTLVKVVVLVAAVIAIVWLGLAGVVLGANLAYMATPSFVVLLGGVLVLGVLALLVLVSRDGGLQDAFRRFGSPGLGRGGLGRGGPDGVAPQPAGAWDATPEGEPTVVLGEERVGDPTVTLGDPGQAGGWQGGVGPAGAGPGAGWQAGAGGAQAGAGPGAGWQSGGAQAGVPQAGGPQDPRADEAARNSVDRARAAAVAAADARAAAAEEARRARVQEARARRAAARAVRKERNRWGKLVAAVTLIVAGVLFLTDRAQATSLGALQIGVICLALLTAGVLVGAWFGSGRWLVLPALLLALVVGGGVFVSEALDRAADAAPIAVVPPPLTAGDMASMSWAEGAVTVDLTQLRKLDSRALSLTVDRGSLTVVVPDDQWVSISSEVIVGDNALDPDGIPLFSSDYQEWNGPTGGIDDPDEGPLYLNLRVGIGDLNVVAKEA